MQPQAGGAQEPDPTAVAANFVRQYYTVLAQRPQDLHRFHAGPSRLSHGTLSDFHEADSQGLSAAVAAQNYEGVVPAVDSVAAQESLGGGLVIMATGTLTWSGKPALRFAHTFFLARQEKGFFVLNDILRLEKSASDAAPPAATAAQTPKPTPAEKKAPAPAAAAAASAAYVAASKATAPKASKQAAAPARKEEKEPAPRSAGDLKNLTYAQRLKIASKKEAGVRVEGAAPAKATPAAAQTGAPPRGGGDKLAGGGAPTSVFVRNLPVVVAPEQVLGLFEAFGPIRGGAGGITIKAQKTNSYAFVDFETRGAAAAAIASALVLDGCDLAVEEKKPQAPKASRPRGRGGKGGAASGLPNSRPRPAMNGGRPVAPHA